jgi:uncharacterized protein YceK
MKNIFVHFTLLVLLSGCAVSTPAANPQAATSTASATLIQPAAATPRPAASATALQRMDTPVPSTTAEKPASSPTAAVLMMTQTNGSLTVDVFSGSDVEVSEPKYTVSGRAPSGTVLSINDEIILVDQSQAFSAEVPLEDGPNLIEIVASDKDGNEVDFMITASYNSEE